MSISRLELMGAYDHLKMARDVVQTMDGENARWVDRHLAEIRSVLWLALARGDDVEVIDDADS